MQQENLSIIRVDNSLALNGKRSASIEIPGQAPFTLSYESYDGPLSTDSGDDAFILGPLLLFMQEGHDVYIEGRISSRLLLNINELQTAWARWRPSKYKVVSITAREYTETHLRDGPAISAFSGGVDAAFTVYDATTSNSHIHLKTALFVHGFDIPIDKKDEYDSARSRGEKMLAGLGIESTGIKTNVRSLEQDWEDSFGLGVASCLSLYQNNHSIGLIGSGKPYDELNLPWGSTPATDYLCSTGNMDIRHYGAGKSRTEKLDSLKNWPSAIENLRVCWQGDDGSLNCGRCEKCIRTYLNLKVVGAPVTSCFEENPDRRAIWGIRLSSKSQLKELKSVVKFADAQKFRAEWVRDLRVVLALNAVRVHARSNKLLYRAVQSLRSIK